MSHNIVTINGKEPDVAGNITGFSANQLIFIGEGASVSYSTSPASSMSAGSVLYLYDDTPMNTITDATISTTGGWIDSVTLPAGIYHIQSSIQVAFSATGALIFGLAEGGSVQGGHGRVGAAVTSHYSASGIASATLELTSSTAVSVRVVAASNVASVGAQGTLISEYGWLLIRKEA